MGSSGSVCPLAEKSLGAFDSHFTPRSKWEAVCAEQPISWHFLPDPRHSQRAVSAILLSLSSQILETSMPHHTCSHPAPSMPYLRQASGLTGSMCVGSPQLFWYTLAASSPPRPICRASGALGPVRKEWNGDVG